MRYVLSFCFVFATVCMFNNCSVSKKPMEAVNAVYDTLIVVKIIEPTNDSQFYTIVFQKSQQFYTLNKTNAQALTLLTTSLQTKKPVQIERKNVYSTEILGVKLL